MLKTMRGTPISSLCFGAMQFGRGANHAAAAAMFQQCRSAGINVFDTAHGYNDGLSEEWLGSFVQAEREDLFFATKLAATGGSARANILAQFDISQRRHGLDCVDLLYLHRWDPDTPLSETFETLAGLQQDGKLRHVGVSNFAAWQVMKANHVAQSFGLRIDAIQPMYNLVKRQAEAEILPMALDQNIAVLPYSPLGGGLLTGKYRGGGTGRLSSDQVYAARYGADWMWDCASKLTDLAAELGHNAATLAVAWIARNPAIAAPIISARSPEQLAPSLAAMGLNLVDDVYAAVTALSKTPDPATDRSEETG
ncbi:aldo/keto reductase [Paracoccus sp. Z330]|uniref:Aldo/keto reductase n=1 Tax=Paracoccus onchidii TaxID=3017813 RepID=A0ABT4ZBN2_9RHOB|nr:aldo/keto reductase [Paracoccus onchidii]MDB6176348.1 aldo/keto reductase [Paracoccus onchidii]